MSISTTFLARVLPALRRMKLAENRRADAFAGLEILEPRILLSGIPGLVNGGFETPNLANAAFAYASPALDGASGVGWQFGGSAGVAANGSAFATQNSLTSAIAGAPQGRQVGFIQGQGSIRQTFDVGGAGYYTVSYFAAQRAPFVNGRLIANKQNVAVLVDGRIVGSIDPNGGYQNYTTNPFFLAAGGAHTLDFQGVDSAGGDNTLLLDNVYLGVSASPAQPTDAGFESPGLAPGTSMYNPTGTSWTFQGLSGISANGSAFTSGNPNAPEGQQVAYIQGTGLITQQFTITNINPQNIVVSFDAAQRASAGIVAQSTFILGGTNHQNFQVYLTDPVGQIHLVGTFTPSGRTYQQFTTAPFQAVFDGTYTLSFVGVDSVGGDNTVLIDNVSLATQGGVSAPQFADSNFALSGLLTGGSQYAPAGTPWSFQGSSGIAANASAFTYDNHASPRSNQAAFLQGFGQISQVFSPTSQGNYENGYYTISVLAAQRAVGYPATTNYENFAILVNGQNVGTFLPSGVSWQQFTSRPFFINTNVGFTVTFQGLDTAGGDNTVLFTNPTTSLVAPSGVQLGGGNLSFESPALSAGQFESGGGALNSASGAGWTFNSGAGISADQSAFTSGNPDAPAGSQVAFLQGFGSISQNMAVAVTGSPSVPAAAYTLSFLAAQRGSGGLLLQGMNHQNFEVLVDGQVVGVFTPGSTNYASFTTNPFYVQNSSGAFNVQILGLDSVGGDNTALIDNVTVNAVALL